MSTLSDATSTKIKSFWERREGKTGLLLVAGLIGGALWGLYHLLPILVTIAWNAVNLTIAGAVLFFLIQLILNGRIQTLASYGIQLISRALTSIFWAVDAEGILKEYVKDRQRKQKRAVEQTERLRGVIKSLEEQKARNERTVQQETSRAQAARKRSSSSELTEEERRAMSLQFSLASSKAGMLRETNLTFEQLIAQLRHYYRIMMRITEAAEFVIQYTQNQVQQIILRRQAVNQAHSAMRNVRAIIKGDAMTELYDETVEMLIADADRKLGEIDGFVETTAAFLSRIDLEKGVFQEEMLKELESLGTKVDAIITGSDQQRLGGTGGAMPIGFTEQEIAAGVLTQGGSKRTVRSIADLIDGK